MTVQRRSAFFRIASRRPRLKNGRPAQHAPVRQRPTKWRTGQGWGRSPSGKSKVRLAGKSSTTADGDEITIRRAYAGLSGLWEQDGRLFGLPPRHIQGLQVAQATRSSGLGGDPSVSHTFRRWRQERLASTAIRATVRPGSRAPSRARPPARLLRDLIERGLSHIGFATSQRDELGGRFVQRFASMARALGCERAPAAPRAVCRSSSGRAAPCRRGSSTIIVRARDTRLRSVASSEV